MQPGAMSGLRSTELPGLAPAPRLASGFRQQPQSAPGPAGAARRPGPEARLGVVLGNEHGGHFIEQLGDAQLARARATGVAGAGARSFPIGNTVLDRSASGLYIPDRESHSV
jgi:hypothetical protein